MYIYTIYTDSYRQYGPESILLYIAAYTIVGCARTDVGNSLVGTYCCTERLYAGKHFQSSNTHYIGTRRTFKVASIPYTTSELYTVNILCVYIILLLLACLSIVALGTLCTSAQFVCSDHGHHFYRLQLSLEGPVRINGYLLLF